MLEIKHLYGMLKDKKAFCTEIAEITGIGARTIYNHWMASFWSIPEKHKDLVLTKLKEKQL